MVRKINGYVFQVELESGVSWLVEADNYGDIYSYTADVCLELEGKYYVCCDRQSGTFGTMRDLSI